MPGKSNGDYPKCPLRMQTLHMFVVGKGDIVRSTPYPAQSPDTDAHTRQSLLPPSCPNPDSCLTGFHNKPACGCSAYWFILGPPSVDSNSKTNLLAPKTSCFYPSVRILVPVPSGFYQWITTLFPGITNPLVHLYRKSKC